MRVYLCGKYKLNAYTSLRKHSPHPVALTHNVLTHDVCAIERFTGAQALLRVHTHDDDVVFGLVLNNEFHVVNAILVMHPIAVCVGVPTYNTYVQPPQLKSAPKARPCETKRPRHEPVGVGEKTSAPARLPFSNGWAATRCPARLTPDK